MTLTHSKNEFDVNLVSQQLLVFEQAHGHVPRDVKRIDMNTYQYAWLEGKEASPRNWEIILQSADDAFWRGTPSTVYNRQKYFQYMEKVVEDLTKQGVLSKEVADRFMGILGSTFSSCKLTPARLIHGDLTLDNSIYNTGPGGAYFLSFIDPGHPRGLCVVDQDVSKLIMSIRRHYLEKAMKYSANPEKVNSITNKCVHDLLYLRRWAYTWCGCKRSAGTINFPKHTFIQTLSVLEACHWLRLMRHPEKHAKNFEGLREWGLDRFNTVIAQRFIT